MAHPIGLCGQRRSLAALQLERSIFLDHCLVLQFWRLYLLWPHAFQLNSQVHVTERILLRNLIQIVYTRFEWLWLDNSDNAWVRCNLHYLRPFMCSARIQFRIIYLITWLNFVLVSSFLVELILSYSTARECIAGIGLMVNHSLLNYSAFQPMSKGSN